ncbi:S-layer homology domain-containing protein [Paenibacillus aurantiacus]|uniref:S-layer homology domain-containing protein n=1 Tax=Paenibacillus aurantiacus TaxID=1936118 RepID=A0ABV5KX81_9BACL
MSVITSRNKWLIAIFVLALLLQPLSGIRTASAENPGTEAEEPHFSGGSGTLESPLIIETEQQLKNVGLAQYVDKHYYFALKNDITLTAPWTPIGTADTPFNGNFLGMGRSIYGLQITGDSSSRIGLFGTLNYARVTNLNIIQGEIHGSQEAGLVAGHVENDALISDVQVTGTVSGYASIGGVVGYSDGSMFTRVTAKVNVTSGQDTGLVNEGFGGMVGKSEESTFGDSSAEGTVNVPQGQGVGGFIGSGKDLHVEQVFTNANVTGGTRVGGLIGYVQGKDNLSDTDNDGTNVLATYAIKDVTGGSYVGGLIGYIDAPLKVRVQNNFSLGQLYSNASSAAGFGGLIGYAEQQAGGRLEVTQSYNTANIHMAQVTTSITPASVGPVFGQLVTNANTGVNNDHYDNQVFQFTDSAALFPAPSGIRGFTTAQMKTQSYFSGLNFNGIWVMQNAMPTNGMPFLSWANTPIPLPTPQADAPPEFLPTYPMVIQTTANAVAIAVKINEAGKVYYVALPKGASQPSATQVKAGKDSLGALAAYKGVIDVRANTYDGTVIIENLVETEYDVFLVAEDKALIPNLQAQSVKVAVRTLDQSPPVFLPTFPKAKLNPNGTAELFVKLDEDSTVFYVVLPRGARSPLPTQVRAGMDYNDQLVGIRGSKVVSGYTEDVINVTGLTPNTVYDLYVIAQDRADAPNLQRSTVKLALNPPDLTPPVFAPTYPKVTQAGTGTAQLLANIDETGTVYYVVVPAGSQFPTPAQVKGGLDGQGQAALFHGSKPFQAYQTDQFALTGLGAETLYDLYVLAEDDEPTPNVQLAATKLEIRPVDDRPPVFAPTYPKVTQVTANAAKFSAQIDEAGKVFYVVVASGDYVPSRTQVKGGLNAYGQPALFSGSKAFAANTADEFTITGIASETYYDVYVLAEDDEPIPNVQLAATKIGIIPVDVTPPVFAPTYPKVMQVTVNSAKFAAQINEAGTIYYVVLPEGSSTPTPLQVKGGLDVLGQQALFSGSKVFGENTPDEFMITGLAANTPYDLYVLAEDDEPVPNEQLVARKLVITPVDLTPPVFDPTYPKLTQVTGEAAQLEAALDEAGKVYYIVVLHGDTAPTANQVKAGLDGGGAAANIRGAKLVPMAHQAVTLQIAGLMSETSYDLYVIAEDDERTPNLQLSPVMLAIHTVDATAPVHATGYPKMVSVSYHTAQFSVQENEAGTVFYLVLPRDAAAPTSAQVKAGVDSRNHPVTLHGSDSVAADTAKTIDLQNLTDNTRYDLYIVAQDLAAIPNVQAHPAKLQFETPAIAINNPGTPSVTSSPGPAVEEITVEVQTGSVGKGPIVNKTPIKRITESAGTIRDDVTLTTERAAETVKILAQSGDDTARVVIPDETDKVSKVDFTVPKEATKALVGGGINLEVYTENVRIVVPQESLNTFQTDDLYFKLVPLKSKQEREVLQERARVEQSVQALANGQEVTAVARPMTIETNMQSRQVTLILPLKDVQLPENAAEREAFLEQLVIYIEHSDGSKQIVQKPRVVQYGASAALLGLEFDVDGFSTFTILHVDEKAGEMPEHSPYIKGFVDHTFRPGAFVTRAEMAAMLARNLEETSVPSGEASFADIATRHWAAGYIASVHDHGIMKGYTNVVFGPEGKITRAQMAAIVYRWLLKSGTPLKEGTANYRDVQESHWASQAIAAIEQSGIMIGYADGSFRPDAELTRAEAVKVLNRLFQRGPLQGVRSSSFPDVDSSHWAFEEIEEASQAHKWTRDIAGNETVVTP